jgi:hypothetical protein
MSKRSDFGCVVHPKARKEYKCELCFGPIQTGENYVGYFGQWEGELQNWKMHAECYQSFSDNSPEDGFMPGEGEMPPYVKALVEDRLRSQAGKCWWQL